MKNWRMITVMIFSSYEEFEKVNLCVNIGVMMIMVVVVMMMMVVVVMIVSIYLELEKVNLYDVVQFQIPLFILLDALASLDFK